MKMKKIIVLSLAYLMGASAILGNLKLIKASEVDSILQNEDEFIEDFTMDYSDLKEYGLTDDEIERFNNYKSSNIMIENGELKGENINIDEIYEGVQARGKFSSAVKLIKKYYKKLPKGVRSFIEKYTKLSIFLGLIEHYTGTLEAGIYNACRKVGMSKNVSNFVTKTIMLFVF